MSPAQEDTERARSILRGATVEELIALCVGAEHDELREARQKIERLEGVIAEWECANAEEETESDRCAELTATLDETRKKLEAEVKAHEVTRWKLEVTTMRAEAAEKSRDKLLLGAGADDDTGAQIIQLKAMLYDYMTGKA